MQSALAEFTPSSGRCPPPPVCPWDVCSSGCLFPQWSARRSHFLGTGICTGHFFLLKKNIVLCAKNCDCVEWGLISMSMMWKTMAWRVGGYKKSVRFHRMLLSQSSPPFCYINMWKGKRASSGENSPRIVALCRPRGLLPRPSSPFVTCFWHSPSGLFLKRFLCSFYRRSDVCQCSRVCVPFPLEARYLGEVKTWLPACFCCLCCRCSIIFFFFLV